MSAVVASFPRNPFAPTYIKDNGGAAQVGSTNTVNGSKEFIQLSFDSGIRGIGRDGATSYHLLRVASVSSIDGGTVNFGLLGDSRFSWMSMACSLDMVGNDIIDVRYVGNTVATYNTRLTNWHTDATLTVGIATCGAAKGNTPVDRLVFGNLALNATATFSNLATLGLSDADVRARTVRHLGYTGASVATASGNLSSWGDDSAGTTTVSSNVTTAPDGTLTADKLEETALGGTKYRYHLVSRTAGKATWTGRIWLKAAERSRVVVKLQNSTGSSYAQVPVTLAAQAGGAASLGTVTTANFTDAIAEIMPGPDLWFAVDVTATTDAASTGIGLLISLANDAGATTYTGVLGSGVYVGPSHFRPAGVVQMKDGLLLRPRFLVANLPPSPQEGAEAYAINGRRSGEGVGAGTGCPVFADSAGAWRTHYDNTVVAA